MVRDHFPINHTDDPVSISWRFTTTVYNLHPRFTTFHYGLQSTSTVYNRSLRFTIYIHGLQFGLQNKQSKTKQQQQKCNKALGHS